MAEPSNEVKIWNATSGYVQIDESGQLLQSHVSAWVDNSSGFIDNLLEDGLVVLVGIAPKSEGVLETPPKKNSRKNLSPSATPKESDESAVAAQDKNDTDYLFTSIDDDLNVANVSVENK